MKSNRNLSALLFTLAAVALAILVAPIHNTVSAQPQNFGPQGNMSKPFTNAAVTTTVSVKASSGTIFGYYIYNPNASACSADIFNTASGSVILGTTAPYLSLVIPATSGANLSITPQAFPTAISVAAVTAAGGNTACGSGMTINLFYQ